MSGLGLNNANPYQSGGPIPAGTQVAVVTKIRYGTVGIETICKRSARGDAELLDLEFVVVDGPYHGRKIFESWVLDGTTSGHATAAGINRSKLRAIYEATHGIAADDTSPATIAGLNDATLASFAGATFMAVVGVEPGGPRPNGGNYKDKNVIETILRPGDQGYRRLDQPPPAPPPAPPSPSSPPPNGSQAPLTIAKPSWAE